MARRRERTPETAMADEIFAVIRDEHHHATAIRRIEEIERQYVEAAGADDRVSLRRSAARWALEAAIDKGAPFPELSARFSRACDLGFDGLFSELAAYLEFAYACGRHCQKDEGLRVLARARERLANSGPGPRSGFVRQETDKIEHCRRRLESGRPTEQSDPAGK